jgi:opacity protein-like surface antigen
MQSVPFLKVSLLGAALLMLLFPDAAQAQDPPKRFEITPHIGYQFGGSTEVEGTEDESGDEEEPGGELDIESAPSFGVTLDSRVRDGAFAELSYSRQQTNLGLRTPGTPRQEVFDMSVEYFQIGGLLDFRNWDSRVAPFFLMTLGATRFAPSDESGLGDEWRFSLALGAGLKVLLVGEWLGLRFQGRFLTTFLSSESQVFCPGNGKCLFVVGDTTATFQGEGSIGAYVAF